jgi:hypothetical protein
MGHESLVKTLREQLSTAPVRHVPVCWVVSEEVALGLKSIGKRLPFLDIVLRSVDDTNEAKLEGVYAAGQNIHSICSMVHEIQLCEDTNSSLARGVDMASQLQSLGVYEIDVCGGDGENDTVRLRNVFGDEVPRLLLDICRLVANGYLQSLTPCAVQEKMPSPTFVRPGKSTSVKLRTCGE